MKKRLLSLLLVICMVLGILPMGVSAADAQSTQDYELKVLTFEGDDWSALIDSPQYGGPLLYPSGASEAYNWYDQSNTELYHAFADEWGDHQYWGGGHAVSDYVSGDVVTYGGYDSQLTVFKVGIEGLATSGGGHNGSDNFAVHYGYVDSSGYSGTIQQSLNFRDGVARVIDHMYVNNTTYALNCYVNGNDLTANIGQSDWVKLVATGYDAQNSTTGIAELYLVNGPDNIVMDWTKWDLSVLGEVVKVEFNVTGSSDNGFGFSQPAYFAYDDVAVRFEREDTTVAVESVTLDQTAVELEVGGAATVTASVAPENATDKTVTWTSSDESVATVADGVVTAVAPGSATITAVSGDAIAECAVTVKAAAEEKLYEVTINVAPSTANVTFYSGDTVDTALTTEVTDNGIVSNYHQYVLTVPEGTYTYRGVDGETDLGGMTFKVPFDEEIMSDGTASGEGLSMTLRRVNYYTTNKTITAIGDYTLRLVPGTLSEVVNGQQYLDTSNRVVTPVLVMARGNALTYQQLVTINGDLAESYAVVPVANVTYSAGTSAQSKTFSVSSIVYHSITAPEDAVVQMFLQINNFNVEELTDKTVSESDADGMVTHTFKTPGGGNLTYRVSMEGKITRAGYLSTTAENVVISYEENEDPNTTESKLDNANIQKRMESSTMLNVNGQNDLHLAVGDTFRLRSYRGAWQIINSDTANIMIEPDFHYEVISGGEYISMDVVDDRCTGNASGNWLDITGVSEGTAVVEVTYDAIQIGGNGSSYGGLYGATDSQRTSLVVIQVGAGERTLQMTADGSANLWDTEYDTVYFLGDTGSMTFTAMLSEETPDQVELSTDKGMTWTTVATSDGKYTADGLVGGNNILRFTKGDVVEYQVVRAAKVTRTITNLTRAEGMIAGDQLKVVYSGLYTPVSKFSGIYNPGFGQGHKVTYTLPDGYTATATGGQYDFISTNTYTLTVPNTASGEVTLSGGHIAFNVMGVSDPLGGHRLLTDTGVGTNFSAVSTQHIRSILPDLTITVTEMPYVDVTVTADVVGTNVVIKDSTGTQLEPENGIYSLPLGTFTYEAVLEGYITERGFFNVTLDDVENKTKTVTLAMRKIEGTVWDGSATTEPQQVDGVYQIGTGAEMAWFAANHGNANALLTADISLGGFNWTPVTAYGGTFDGNGHWITDLYINSTSANQGLFAQLSSNGVIKNLGVSGGVTSTGNTVGGIVGQLRNKATIDSCVSDVTVSGGRYVGGIAGQQYMSSTISNCYNLGNITSTSSSGNAGGISGGYTIASQSFTIENCYNLGTITAAKNYGGLTYSTKATNAVNSYYVSGSADSGNSSTGTVVTADELKDMSATLGDAWVSDTADQNDGYPILVWQANRTTEGPAEPVLTLEFPTLVFEDEILMNVYFSAENLENVVEMGLITYSEQVSEWSVETSESVLPGYTWSETAGLYYATTEGIAAKCLGDTIYFAVYAELSDGSYLYTSLVCYSPRTYAYSQLETGDAQMKALMVAMLNYGAAAQVYFGYNTDAMVNADMTEDQLNLVEAYRSDMMDSVIQPDASKLGEMVGNGGYTRRYPTVSFEGAFCINCYFLPSATVSGDITMYVWNQADFDATEVLSKSNATVAIPMTLTESGEYLAVVEGIAAKDLDKGVYVSFCYSDGTTDYCSGVIGYSIGLYCNSCASKTDIFADLAAATAVYGYYAEQFFD